MNPMKAPRTPEVKYRRQLEAYTKGFIKVTQEQIIPLIHSLETEYVQDEHVITTDTYVDFLEERFRQLRAQLALANSTAKLMAIPFVSETNRMNKDRFYSAVKNTAGVDLGVIARSENLEDTLRLSVTANVDLITSIPEQYFKKLEGVVYRGMIEGQSATSLTEQVMAIGKVEYKRAKLIARDQTSKLNSALTKQRAQNVGSEEYIWRTAGDGRVRDSHIKNNGKTFRWDDPPPKTGHPGTDIQCRCVAQVVIKV